MKMQDVPFGRTVEVEKVADTVRSDSFLPYAKAGSRGVLLPCHRLYKQRGTELVGSDDDVSVLDDELPRPEPDAVGGWPVGCDPEVFVFAGNELLPAWEFLPAKQETQLPQIFWDGFQAEFTTNPTGCHAFVVDGIRAQLYDVQQAAKSANRRAELSAACVVDVSHGLLESASDEHVALGCNASLSAYPSAEPLSLPNGRYVPIRTAGFHIHMGFGPTTVEQAVPVVQSIDVLAGVLSVSLLAGLEDERRRSLYGRAGEFRLPPHGLEYRTFSSAVLAHPIITHIVLDLTRASVQRGIVGESVLGVSALAARDIIDHLDVDGARRLIDEKKEALTTLIGRLYSTNHMKVLHVLRHGASSMLPVDNMAKSWRLPDTWEVHSNSPDASVRTWRS